MSALLAVAQAVTTAPVAVSAPVVVHDTITKVITVPAVSPQLMAGLELAGLALAGYLLSVLHQVFESLSKNPNGWARGLNVFLQIFVGLIVSAVTSYFTGHLQLNLMGIEDFAGQFLLIMGASQTRYTFFKWVQSLGTASSAQNPVAEPLAVEAAMPVPTKASI